ncbi:hypothetical protein [Chitinilyticum piscinae]|uniref:Uncharacterized protein n=1 Tax=Chitinilyticum piscinae TaxID=2866724 RepID=A0A8J7FNK6_9NEIS|nr:hypothetical protein [Chitinilyticum piscinae]MBE9610066.1 hypothetical protein [Chitinilyticum piscinae]
MNHTTPIGLLLPFARAKVLTDALAWHPLVRTLDALVLDDTGTSEHHLLLRHPALAGCVLYLVHDGESRLVAESPAQWQTLLAQAIAAGCALVELHPAQAPLAPDQPALQALLQGAEHHDNDSTLLTTLLPSLDLEQADQGWLNTLATNEDFYLGEALARTICLRPAPELLPLAERCRQHPHPQVAQAGQLAVRAVRKAMHQEDSNKYP